MTTIHAIAAAVAKLGRATVLQPRPLFPTLAAASGATLAHATLSSLTFTLPDGSEMSIERAQPSAEERAAGLPLIPPAELPGGADAAEGASGESLPADALLKVPVGEGEEAYFFNRGAPRHGKVRHGLSLSDGRPAPLTPSAHPLRSPLRSPLRRCSAA